MDSLVSIVVPIYNVENYIEKCIESIINQTYKNLEIILINDGSPDNSGLIADRYAENDSRIKVIHKRNGGLSDARNAGLGISTGDFICFVDSDDYIELNTIEVALNEAQKTTADVVVFSFFNELISVENLTIKMESVPINRDDPKSMVATIGYAWNKLYKTSFITTHHFSFTKGLSLVEDIVFNEKVINAANKIAFVNKALYHYTNRYRPTLVKQYHEDSYQLHKLGFNARKNVMLILFSENKETESVIAASHIGGIRYCCSNMFYYKNNLSLTRKYNHIKMMLNDEDTSDQIKVFKALDKSEKLLKLVIRNKLSFILFSIYYLRSIIVLNKNSG